MWTTPCWRSKTPLVMWWFGTASLCCKKQRSPGGISSFKNLSRYLKSRYPCEEFVGARLVFQEIPTSKAVLQGSEPQFLVPFQSLVIDLAQWTNINHSQEGGRRPWNFGWCFACFGLGIQNSTFTFHSQPAIFHNCWNTTSTHQPMFRGYLRVGNTPKCPM